VSSSNDESPVFYRDGNCGVCAVPRNDPGDGAERRLALPRSFQFDQVALAFNPDFNTKSRGNMVVMRWEHKPGSTLFFVWYLSQTDFARPGQFSPLRDLGSAFGADATHVLMVKASYWLNR
jgi:hypothetical protein